MKKYESYNLIADFGEVNEDFESYKMAFAAYQREVGLGYPCTLYGRTYEGDICVIFSHA